VVEELMIKMCEHPSAMRVCVVANDYSYDGWLTSVFRKRSGAWRCIVEDYNGRLFIHNAGQIEPHNEGEAP
jgi:hypothetical protein